MSTTTLDVPIFPRPSARDTSTKAPLVAPSEGAFTSTFGRLLPPAAFLTTNCCKVAYYSLPPSTSSNRAESQVDRVLIVHGVHTPALGMLPLARALRTSFRSAHFVLFDLYGHGLSDAPVVPYTRELFQELINVLLERLEWPSAHLIGYSFGGATVVKYATAHPLRVQSLTLVAPAGLLRPTDYSTEHLRGDNEPEVSQFTLDWLEGGPLAVPEDWHQRVENGEIVSEAVRDWQNREHPGHIPAVVAIIRDAGVINSHALFRDAAQTGIPSVAILGELDDVCTARDLNELGFSNVTVVPQAGHSVVRDNVAEVAEVIARFWDHVVPLGTSHR